MVIPALGSRWRVGTGNVYEVTAVEGTRVTLLPRQLSADCERELREFASNNRLDPDAEVATFMARPMVVDLAWFTRRPDVREVSGV